MARRIIGILMLFAALTTPLLADEVSMGASNRSDATQGFERDIFDFTTNPAFFGLVPGTSLVASLDRQTFGSVFQNVQGLKAALNLSLANLLLNFAVIYDTNANGLSSSLDDGAVPPANLNVEYAYTGYDATSGRYNTIVESVTGLDLSETNSASPDHNLRFHIGIAPSESIGIALQGRFAQDRYQNETLSFSNTYSDTAAPSDATLTSSGNRTTTAVNLLQGTDIIAIEPEFGLNFGTFNARIALGFGINNMIGANDLYSQTVISYAGGFDPTLEDSRTTTEYQGAYYWTGAPTARFNMGSAYPNAPASYALDLGADLELGLNEDLHLVIPVTASYTIYPAQSAISRTITDTYNETTVINHRSVTETATALTVDRDLYASLGGGVRSTLHPAENAAFHLGAILEVSLSSMALQLAQTRTQNEFWDNDANANFTSTGDVNTTYVQSGYNRQDEQLDLNATLSLPIAVSYAPVPALILHAGATTYFNFGYTSTSSRIDGDPAYIYEAFTDNLVATNTYTQRLKDNSDNQNTPTTSSDFNFGFNVGSSFGFTLNVSDNFSIEAIADADGLAFNEFSLMCSYTFASRAAAPEIPVYEEAAPAVEETAPVADTATPATDTTLPTEGGVQ